MSFAEFSSPPTKHRDSVSNCPTFSAPVVRDVLPRQSHRSWRAASSEGHGAASSRRPEARACTGVILPTDPCLFPRGHSAYVGEGRHAEPSATPRKSGTASLIRGSEEVGHENASLACVLVLVTASAARAQDPATVDAKHYRVLIDNERTRVFHVVIGPGEKVPMPGHPDVIMIPLAAPPTPVWSPAPAAIFIPAQEHEGANTGPTPVDFIYVELKGTVAPTAPSPRLDRHHVDPPPRACQGGRDARDGRHRLRRAGRGRRATTIR
jgi:beta-alanine degradation protein BauB